MPSYCSSKSATCSRRWLGTLNGSRASRNDLRTERSALAMPTSAAAAQPAKELTKNRLQKTLGPTRLLELHFSPQIKQNPETDERRHFSDTTLIHSHAAANRSASDLRISVFPFPTSTLSLHRRILKGEHVYEHQTHFWDDPLITRPFSFFFFKSHDHIYPVRITLTCCYSDPLLTASLMKVSNVHGRQLRPCVYITLHTSH